MRFVARKSARAGGRVFHHSQRTVGRGARPATARTLRGAARQIAAADTALKMAEIQKAGA